MPARRVKRSETDPLILRGVAHLRRVFPLLAVLAASGTARDKAGNRRLRFSQYAALVLVGMFNPVLQSARALVAASGLKKVRQLTGGGRVSLGSFSEAASVFDPRLLAGLVQELRSQWQRQRQRQRLRWGRRLGAVPDALLERLVAVDGSVLTALPQVAGRLGQAHKGQWRLHAHVRVCDGTVRAATVTEEPATGQRSERNVLIEQVAATTAEGDRVEPGSLLLLDRGYRSAALFNRLHAADCEYVARLNRTDGRVVDGPMTDEAGKPLTLPPLSDAARELGIVADEWISLGGHCGASPVESDHPLRRITLVPPPTRASAARQGRVRTDQSGRDELVLATNLRDVPAEHVVLLYEQRWQVELFFRFLKQVLRCEQLITAKTAGVQIQLYCAIIASLLLALATGGNLTRRHYEMVCLYLSGWADEDELLETLSKPPP